MEQDPMNLTYTVVLLRERDGRYSAIVPALEGCATWGHTLPEALRMVEDAIDLYLETLAAHGQSIPADVETFTVEMGEATEAAIYRVVVGAKEAVAVA